MNKTEYLNQLNKYLKKLPKPDYENAMDYFTEYFQEAGEQRAMEELGTPKEAAAEILNNLLSQNMETEQTATDEIPPSFRRTASIAFMSILAAPFGIPVALGIILILLIVFFLFFCIAVWVFFCSFSMLWLGAKYLVQGIMGISHSLSGACVIAGIGIFGIGCGILISLCMVWFYKWIVCKIMQVIHKLSIKKK